MMVDFEEHILKIKKEDFASSQQDLSSLSDPMEALRRGQNQSQGVKTTGAIRHTLLHVSSHRTTRDQRIGDKVTITFVF